MGSQLTAAKSIHRPTSTTAAAVATYAIRLTLQVRPARRATVRSWFAIRVLPTVMGAQLTAAKSIHRLTSTTAAAVATYAIRLTLQVRPARRATVRSWFAIRVLPTVMGSRPTAAKSIHRLTSTTAERAAIFAPAEQPAALEVACDARTRQLSAQWTCPC